MFRRIILGKTRRDAGVKFCDGHGISTQAERADCRLDEIRNSGALQLPRV